MKVYVIKKSCVSITGDTFDIRYWVLKDIVTVVDSEEKAIAWKNKSNEVTKYDYEAIEVE